MDYLIREHMEALIHSLHFIYCYGYRVLVGYVDFLTIGKEWKVYIHKLYYNIILAMIDRPELMSTI